MPSHKNTALHHRKAVFVILCARNHVHAQRTPHTITTWWRWHHPHRKFDFTKPPAAFGLCEKREELVPRCPGRGTVQGTGTSQLRVLVFQIPYRASLRPGFLPIQQRADGYRRRFYRPRQGHHGQYIPLRRPDYGWRFSAI